MLKLESKIEDFKGMVHLTNIFSSNVQNIYLSPRNAFLDEFHEHSKQKTIILTKYVLET